MKKVLAIFLIFILLTGVFSSCNNDEKNTENSDEPKELSEDPTSVINIYRPPTPNLNTYLYEEDWETYIKELYGVDIKIHNISPLYQYDITIAKYYPSAIQENKISGLIEIKQWEIENLLVLMNQGLILPLDDYLADNAAYQAMPGAMKNAYIMPDGQTWAIATSSPLGLYSRKLKKEWVDELDMMLPENLSELYELTRSFAFKDPNGNGENDEHGMDYDSRLGAIPFLDIFIANGCYLSNNSNSSFAYDYQTDSYEDAVLKPGMKDALLYIKALHDDGLLHANSAWDFAQKSTSGNFMSLSLNTDYRVIDINNWYEVYTLSENDISIMGLRPYKMFVMTANTQNPKSTINKFVDVFLSDTNGMARGNYGIEGQSYSFSNKTLKCLYGEEGTDLSKFVAENISLTHFNFNLLIEDGVTLVDPQWTDISIDGAIRETQLYNKFFEEGKLFFDSNFMYDDRNTGIDSSFSKSFSNYLFNIDSVSIDDFISNYIKSAKESGFDDVLDSYNQQAGKVASYNYD